MGAFVKEVVCTVVHLCSNLTEVITLVLDACDTSWTPFHKMCLPQFSTNTVLVQPRSCHFQLLCATQVRQWRCCCFLICHIAQWTSSLAKSMPWTRGCHGDHAIGVLCNVFVLCSARPRPLLRVWACLACPLLRARSRMRFPLVF